MSNPTLEELIEIARHHNQTEEERIAQIKSFAFGNTHLDNPAVTREGIGKAYNQLFPGKVSDE